MLLVGCYKVNLTCSGVTIITEGEGYLRYPTKGPTSLRYLPNIRNLSCSDYFSWLCLVV